MIVFSKKLRAKLRNYFRFLRFDGDKSFASPQTGAKPDLLNDGFAAEVCRRRDTLHQFDGRDNHTVSRFQQEKVIVEAHLARSPVTIHMGNVPVGRFRTSCSKVSSMITSAVIIRLF